MTEPTRPAVETRVTATITVALSVEHDGRIAAMGPNQIDVDLTDLVKQRREPIARHIMPMRVEQAAGQAVRQMLALAGLAHDTEAPHD